MKTRTLKGAGLGAVAAIGFLAAALVGVAVAKTFTLNVASGAKVTNQQSMSTHESILVGSHRRATYSLTGDSKSHPECKQSNQCFKFWPPVTVAAGKTPSKAPGISGKLSLWHRNGFSQVVLAGHPLYYYAGDTMGANATGEGIITFGGTWHVWKTGSSGGSTGTTSTMMNTTPTNTTPCIPYPPLYPCP